MKIVYDLSEYEEDGGRISLAVASRIAEEGYGASVSYNEDESSLVVNPGAESREEVEEFVDDLLENL